MLTACGDAVSSSSMVHSSTNMMSPNREAGAEASSQNDHPQNEMLTLDLEDTVSLDNKQCQVVLEMPEKYESSCKKLNNQEASLSNGAKESIILSKEREEQSVPGRSNSVAEVEKGAPDADVFSLKSPSKLDLAHDPEDIDLTDRITVEEEPQKPPPESIL